MVTDKQSRLGWVIALSIAAGIIISSRIMPGGGDLYEYYLPFAQGCNTCGYVPYFARWVLFPLAVTPPSIVWTFWSILSIAAFLLVSKKSKVNAASLMASMPMLAQLWGGQIDFLVALGLLLLWQAKFPFVRGMGIVLALVKPQLSFLAIFFLLLDERKTDWWKIALAPILVFVLSLLVFGPSWVIEWINHALTLPVHLRRQASIDIWRFGLILLPLPFFTRERWARLVISLAVAAVATPFYSAYSYLIILAFFCPAWVTVLSYSWLLALPWLGELSIRLSWVLPLGIILYFTYELWKKRSSDSLQRWKITAISSS